MADEDIMTLADNLRGGVPMATPVFDVLVKMKLRLCKSWRGYLKAGKPPYMTAEIM